jgi:hypothetical protein
VLCRTLDEKQQPADDDELAHSSTDKAAILALKIAAATGGPQRAKASDPRIPRDLLHARSASMLTEAQIADKGCPRRKHTFSAANLTQGRGPVSAKAISIAQRSREKESVARAPPLVD